MGKFFIRLLMLANIGDMTLTKVKDAKMTVKTPPLSATKVKSRPTPPPQLNLTRINFRSAYLPYVCPLLTASRQNTYHVKQQKMDTR